MTKPWIDREIDLTQPRILMLLENNPYRRDRRVRLEAEALCEAGCEVAVICPRGEGEFGFAERVGRVDVLHYPVLDIGTGAIGYVWEYLYRLMWTLAMVAWSATTRGFDVLHAHNPPDLFFLVAAPYKAFGRKFVYDHHDLAPELFCERYTSSGPIPAILRSLRRASCRVADLVITTNESQRVVCERDSKRSTPVVVVRNGPDTDRFRPVDPDPELRSRASTVLGYVGIMGPQDGVDRLLRAVYELVHRRGIRSLLCLLVGSGDELPRLRALARELDIEAHVHFAGWVGSDHELARLLCTADICVVPDPPNPVNDRSTMIKVMEYMCLHKPIVAYDLPETRYTAGEAAVYAESDDPVCLAESIQLLANDSARRTRMGEEGARRIHDRFKWEHSAEVLKSVYRHHLFPDVDHGRRAANT